MQSSNLPSTALHLISDGLARMRIVSRWMRCFLFAAACSASVSLPALGQVQEQTSGPPVPASAIPALARGLVEDSRRLVEAIQLESGNAPWKQRMKVRATALLKAAEQFERGAKRPAPNPDPRRVTLDDVRQAYQPIAGELALPALECTCGAADRRANRPEDRFARESHATRPDGSTPRRPVRSRRLAGRLEINPGRRPKPAPSLGPRAGNGCARRPDHGGPESLESAACGLPAVHRA